MLPDTGIDDIKKQRNAEYAKHINDPVLSSLKMEGIHLLFYIQEYKHLLCREIMNIPINCVQNIVVTDYKIICQGEKLMLCVTDKFNKIRVNIKTSSSKKYGTRP
jgi:hypothetical protein